MQFGPHLSSAAFCLRPTECSIIQSPKSSTVPVKTFEECQALSVNQRRYTRAGLPHSQGLCSFLEVVVKPFSLLFYSIYNAVLLYVSTIDITSGTAQQRQASQMPLVFVTRLTYWHGCNYAFNISFAFCCCKSCAILSLRSARGSPTFTLSPRLTANMKSSGASKTRTIVEPVMHQEEIS